MMVLVLAGMVSGSVLIIGQCRLGWTEMNRCGRYVLDKCMDDVFVLCIWLMVIDEAYLFSV